MKKCTRCKPGLMFPRFNLYYPNVTMMTCENCNFTYAIKRKPSPPRKAGKDKGR